MVGREHRRCPSLSLLEFAIADEGKDTAILGCQPGRQSETDGSRQTLAKRAANEINKRRALGADRLELGSILAVGREFLRIGQTEFGGRRIDSNNVVAGRQDETIAAATNKSAAEQHRENFRRRQGLTEVAESLNSHHPGSLQADACSELAQLLWIGARHGFVSNPQARPWPSGFGRIGKPIA